MATSAHVRNYIAETAARAAKYAEVAGKKVYVWYYVREGYEPAPETQRGNQKTGNEKLLVVDKISSILEVYDRVREAMGWKQ